MSDAKGWALLVPEAAHMVTRMKWPFFLFSPLCCLNAQNTIFIQSLKKTFKYLAVVCCAVFLGWQQVGLLAGVALALIREKRQTGLCETARRVGMAALHTQRSWLNKSPFGTFNPAENLAVGEVTSLESITPTIASPG